MTSQLVTALHVSPCLFSMLVTGGGASSIGLLTRTPGASATLLSATVPYARSALQRVLGCAPSSYCSEETAGLMARAARRTGMELWARDAGSLATLAATPVLGVGCTSALHSPGEREGRVHRCFVAVEGVSGCFQSSVVLSLRTREEQEDACAALVLVSMAQAAGLPEDLWGPALTAAGLSVAKSGPPCTDAVATMVSYAPVPIDGLLASPAGTRDCVLYVRDGPGDGLPGAQLPPNSVILGGSFNPLHEGHEKLLLAAVEHLKSLDHDAGPGVFELAATNADKGALGADVVRARVAQFMTPPVGAGTPHPVVVTTTPLFTDKAKLFPGCCFVVGYDTAVRLVAPKYYGGHDQMVIALAAVRTAGCRFVVAGRRDSASGEFLTLVDIAMPEALLDLFIPLPTFRVDLSSSELRAAGQRV